MIHVMRLTVGLIGLMGIVAVIFSISSILYLLWAGLAALGLVLGADALFWIAVTIFSILLVYCIGGVIIDIKGD